MLKVLKYRAVRTLPSIRWYSDCGGGSARLGLVLGAYQDECTNEYKLTQSASKFNEESGGKLKELIKDAGIKKGNARVFTNVSNEFASVAVGGLGPEGVGWNDMEKLDECKENIRIATAHAARALQDEGASAIFVEPFTNAEAAAESAYLAVWRYQELKNREHQLIKPKVDLFGDTDREGWERGKVKGENQNLARKIEETPANMMTPTLVAQTAIENLCPCGVAVDVRDKDWIEIKKMSGFLTITKGSCEPPLFLEMGYCGGSPEAPPFILVGKGITSDMGGLCLKNCEGLSEYRGDLAGAAVVIAVLKCIAQMALPINVIGLVPLCENMPGGLACKPGDLVIASNGKSITIDDTDNEGRILLADALVYSIIHKPCAIIELSTFTPSMRRCLGTSSTGAFTTTQDFWREFERAGGETGDRMWRFPIWKIFKTKVTEYLSADLHNVGRGNSDSAVCKTAPFALEFSPVKEFALLDISGTGMLSNGVGHPYLREGTMSGRPTRTIVQFFYQIACPHSKGDDC